ncbi:MAG: hypothetical protein WC476_01545 [Phycisphaerae bacterium]|jgi:hypothetical protein
MGRTTKYDDGKNGMSWKVIATNLREDDAAQIKSMAISMELSTAEFTRIALLDLINQVEDAKTERKIRPSDLRRKLSDSQQAAASV